MASHCCIKLQNHKLFEHQPLVFCHGIKWVWCWNNRYTMTYTWTCKRLKNLTPVLKIDQHVPPKKSGNSPFNENFHGFPLGFETIPVIGLFFPWSLWSALGGEVFRTLRRIPTSPHQQKWYGIRRLSWAIYKWAWVQNKGSSSQRTWMV